MLPLLKISHFKVLYFYLSRESSTNEETEYRFNDWWPRFTSRQGRTVLLANLCRLYMGSPQPPIKWMLRTLFPAVEEGWRVKPTDHLHQRWSYNPLPSHVFTRFSLSLKRKLVRMNVRIWCL
jgi:hypothetical protein